MNFLSGVSEQAITGIERYVVRSGNHHARAIEIHRVSTVASADARWLHTALEPECDRFGVQVKLNDDDTLSW